MVLAGLETDAPAVGPAHRGVRGANGCAGRRADAERVAGDSAGLPVSVQVREGVRTNGKNQWRAAEEGCAAGPHAGGAGVLLREERCEPGAAVSAGVYRSGVCGANEDVLRDAEDDVWRGVGDE